jgi:hypothetical protein
MKKNATLEPLVSPTIFKIFANILNRVGLADGGVRRKGCSWELDQYFIVIADLASYYKYDLCKRYCKLPSPGHEDIILS